MFFMLQVMHSQRPRETPLKPWLIAEKTGKILCGHCDCVAGIGETCTHISALLFYIDTKVRIRDSQTVTQEAAYWKIPSSVKEVTYLPVGEIDFTSAKSKKKILDALVNHSINLTPGKRQVKHAPPPSTEDLADFFQKLSVSGSKAAVLSVLPEHCMAFKPVLLADKFPLILTDLFEQDAVKLSFNDLLKKCENIQVTVTEEQAKCVEQATRTQASNKLWFRFRSGRVTASRMKNVCRSNPDQPSQSLIKAVCYPEAGSFAVAATKWGCTHEDTARRMYIDRMQESHHSFELTSAGFFINPQFPHIGATPDGLVSCDCCGTGVVEIKCPYCAITAPCRLHI
ncbi:PREDICTED: uncharacterized protein LOC106814124 [Priapulus caudatus]|uniref:Uncharacterized protein LOC106814124 n=1 Tax=Priapulus caudatus TaxID=37621 RepID=A0ABM1ENX6_PRICU|nr:PREDICTED: uncharacterized protein LOC106814124 [Priapulus caudatus]